MSSIIDSSKNETKNSVLSIARAPLNSQSPIRILSAIFGGVLLVYSFIALILTIGRAATGISPSLLRGIIDIFAFAVLPLTGGLVFCWLAFRKGNASDRQSKALMFLNKGIALIFGLFFAFTGLARLYITVTMVFVNPSKIHVSTLIVTMIGAGFTALGIVLLKKFFSRSY